MSRRIWRRVEEYWRSNTFAIVVAPAMLSLIGLYVGDVLQRPKVAVLLTIALAVLLSLLFIVVPRRNARRVPLASAGEAADADAVVLFLSVPQTSSSSSWRSKSAQGVILDGLDPSQIYAIGTGSTGSAEEYLRAEFGDRIAATHTLASNEDYSARAANLAVNEAIEVLAARGASRIAIDVTGGTKPMSIGAYEAAASRGVMAVYLSQDKPARVLRLLEPSDTGD